MEVKPKNPKRVEQGKKLAECNKERREGKQLEQEERKRADQNEFEAWKKQKDEPLTIQDNSSPQEKTTKITLFVPVLALAVIGVGTFWYYRKPKTEEKPERSKFVDRLQKYQK